MLLLLAFALSMDSVVLSLASGANSKNLNFFDALKISFIFGFFQALMPLLGYFLGLSFVSFIQSIEHFIAFFILCFLGIKMIKESREKRDECALNLTGKELIFGAIATSIDALAVGITFSLKNTNIITIVIVIGLVCFVLCFIACYLGKILGKWLGKKALILGGVILISLGTKILIDHLSS